MACFYCIGWLRVFGAVITATILMVNSPTIWSTAFSFHRSNYHQTNSINLHNNNHRGSRSATFSKDRRTLLQTNHGRGGAAAAALAMVAPKVGLVGLPNVGKSTLFNAVSRQADLARAANFPFCTIEPNTAPVAIRDDRLGNLSAKFVQSGPIRPARIELIDVAGLVQGASRGEGLGNQFLGVIRECSVIIHVLRYFDDPEILRHESLSSSSSSCCVDPVFDAAIVHHELMMADVAHVERRLSRIKNPEGSKEALALTKVLGALNQSLPARRAGLTPLEEKSIRSMGLLTLKPVLYALNADEIDFTANRANVEETIRTQIMPAIRACTNDENASEGGQKDDENFVLVSAKLEEDLLSLGGPHEQAEYISELMSLGEDGAGNGRNVDSSNGSNDNSSNEELYQHLLSYNVLPKLVCRLLSLSLCFTGPGVPQERSQTTKAYLFGTSPSDNDGGGGDDEPMPNPSLTAFGLAGKIHGDLQKGFLRAEVVSADDLLRFDSFRRAREEGCVRTEGRDYVVRDGDTLLIKWKE